MSDESSLALVERGWDLWIAGDLAAYLEVWDPDEVWTMPGDPQISGTWRGRDEIARFAEIVVVQDGRIVSLQNSVR